MSCVVRGCESVWYPNCGVKFHGFPSDPDLRSAWLSNIPLKSFYKSARICSLHFRSEDYYQNKPGRLLKSAIPKSCRCCKTLKCCNLPSTSQESVLKASAMPILEIYLDENEPPRKKRIFEELEVLPVSSNTPAVVCSPASETDSDSDDSLHEETTRIVACRVCLATDVKLHAIVDTGIENTFIKIMDVQFSPLDGLPSHLCYLCHTELSKYAAFRQKCRRSQELLEPFKEGNPLKMSDIYAIDRHAHKLARNLVQKNVHHFDSNGNIVFPNTVIGEFHEDNERRDNLIFFKSTDPINGFNGNVKGKIHTNDESNETQQMNKKEIVTAEQKKHKGEVLGISDDEMGEPMDVEELLDSFKAVPSKSIEVATNTIKVHPTNKVDLKFKRECDPKVNESIEKLKKLNGLNISRSIKVPVGNTEKNGIVLKEVIANTNVALNKVPRVKRKLSTGRMKKYDDSFYRIFYEIFEKDYNVKMRTFTEEEQKLEIEAMKTSANYLNAPYPCQLCGKFYNYEDVYRRHMAYHDPKYGPFECQVCHLRYRTEGLLKHHRLTHRFIFTCETCGLVLRGGRTKVKNHYETHSGRTHKCPYCDKQYTDRLLIWTHVRKTHPGQNIPCDECGETFLSARGVLQHKNRIHRLVVDEPEKQLQCKTCHIQFSDLDALENHISSATDVTHASLRPCVACGENCRSEEELAVHAAACYRRRELYCEQCDKTFKNAASYDTHYRRKHLNERRVHKHRRLPTEVYRFRRRRQAPDGAVCDVCGKVCGDKSTLRLHILRHTSVKPYVCDTCSKSFSTRPGFLDHLATHTGEKTHQCSQCSRCYGNRHALRTHMNNVHKQYVCSICDKLINGKTNLHAHVKRVHNDGEQRLTNNETPEIGLEESTTMVRPSVLMVPLEEAGPESGMSNEETQDSSKSEEYCDIEYLEDFDE